MSKIDLNQGRILKKNKDYENPDQAALFYEKQRLTELASCQFPDSEYPEGFKELVIKLMKFQNPVQMNVWHNEKVLLTNSKTGEKVSTTWRNLCTFNRTFSCAEMFQCIEILKRVTPNELWMSTEPNLRNCNFNDLLDWFNDIEYPKIESIVQKVETVLYEIEEQIMSPIRAKINSDLKIIAKMPLTSTVEFIKARERKM